MADESAITLTKAAEAQLVGKSIIPIVGDPDGVPDDFRLNLASALSRFYKISATVASNNLTVALQHLDGSNPSTNNPLAFKIGDVFKITTSTLSVTKNAGTNWCNAGSTELAARAIDFFVYVIKETGAAAGLKIAFSRIPYALTMADFVNTTTSEKYIPGSWTNFNSTDEVTNVGRFRAQLSAAASHNWSIASTVIISRPIYETDWLSYTPVVTSDTGTITTVGAVSGAYQFISKDMNLDQSGVITTNGTGATAIRISIPFQFLLSNAVCPGRELVLTGSMLQGLLRTGYILWFDYNNVYPGGTGASISGGGSLLRLV